VLLPIGVNSKQHWVTTRCCFEFTKHNEMNSINLILTSQGHNIKEYKSLKRHALQIQYKHLFQTTVPW